MTYLEKHKELEFEWRGGGEELKGVVEQATVIKIHQMKKILQQNKTKVSKYSLKKTQEIRRAISIPGFQNSQFSAKILEQSYLPFSLFIWINISDSRISGLSIQSFSQALIFQDQFLNCRILFVIKALNLF